MKKYLFHLRKGLRWSVLFYIVYFILTWLRKGKFESIYGYLSGFFIFILLAGPLWSYLVITINRKKDKKKSVESKEDKLL